jgi:hypothetical protein
MILEELRDLEKYIISDCQLAAAVTDRDISSAETPFCKIVIDRDATIYRELKNMLTLELPLNLLLIEKRENILPAWTAIERMLLKLNQFNSYKGHELTGDISPDYREEYKTRSKTWH